MRNYILKNYIKLSPDSVIIWHHGSIHFKDFFVTLGFIALLWILYSICQYFFPSLVFITWILAGLWAIIYIRFILQFLNHYLDAIVINQQGISIFQRNKLLNYSLQHCHRDNIESISQSQTSVGDRIFWKWEISITLDHGINTQFDYIENPRQVSTLLRDKKTQFESQHTSITNHSNDPFEMHGNEKFDILVETLGEVIKDYMDKDKNKHHPDKRSM